MIKWHLRLAPAALKISILTLSLSAAIPALAQQSRLEPRQPRWGQTVLVTYDNDSAQAKIKSSVDLHLVVEMIFPDRTVFRSFIMKKSKGLAESRFEIPSQLSAMKLHFVTLEGGWDQSAYLSAAISREDGRPARGAIQSKILGADYAEFFRQEVTLYPENYSAYRSKWSLALDLEGEKVARTILSDMARLGRIGTPSAELLSVLSYGHSLFSEVEKSRDIIRTLVEKHPESAFTARAIADYELRFADQELERDRGRELFSWKVAVLEKAPSNDSSRRLFVYMAGNSQLPMQLSESIAGAWMTDEPDNPLAPLSLAVAQAAQYRNYDRALQLIEKSIDLLIAGRLRLHGDISGADTARLTGQAYLVKADLLLRSARYDAAMTTVKVAQTFDIQPRFAGHLLEARILWAAGKKDAAQTSYLEAWRRGSQEALERLKTDYIEKSGSAEGFERYLSELQTRADNLGGIPVDKRPLPGFRALTINGSVIDLNGLQGKIVVINLWFIACGPCRREIPELNRLTDEFKGSDIAFLALSPDSPEALRNFLATTRFNYQIIPDAEDLIEGVFQATAFPTHLVINRDGQVEASFVGGGGEKPSEVRRELLRLLKAD